MGQDVTTFLVEDMVCNHCEEAIKSAVSALQGVNKVEVYLNEKKVKVEYDPEKVSFKELKDTIIEEGYKPDLFNTTY